MTRAEVRGGSVFVEVAGVRNFRDAGGVGALPRGVLYRSGALDGLLPAGARRLAELGVRTVVDLRSAPEVRDRPDDCRGLPVDHCHLPVFREQRWPAEQAELYPAMAEQAGPAAVALVRRLAAPGAGPVLVHCASGKERTGVVARGGEQRPPAAQGLSDNSRRTGARLPQPLGGWEVPPLRARLGVPPYRPCTGRTRTIRRHVRPG
ncbi:tyrosine-protein phosphatase [Kitasatospora sp. NPDC051914]|uniref:tyrosine-protein phosphatase n=1 Tax=Kitasatospora sp. NPDC051914 TaxID=3154945 RepID=UPI00342E0F4A